MPHRPLRGISIENSSWYLTEIQRVTGNDGAEMRAAGIQYLAHELQNTIKCVLPPVAALRRITRPLAYAFAEVPIT
jgi:hypothetical protein